MKFSEIRMSASALLMTLAVVSHVQAQSSTPVIVDIAPCMTLTVNAARYACYDRVAAAAREGGSTPALTTAPPPVAPATVPADVPANVPASPPQAADASAPPPVQTTATSVEAFGQLSPSETRAAQVRANSGGEEELHDRIASVQQREPNRWLITLESGQVWYQSNSQRFRLVKGMAVRIYPSPLRGSYRLARDDGKETGFIQVERVK